MNIDNITNEDFKNLAASLLWCHCVEHSDEYSGYDIIQNPPPKSFWVGMENPYPRGNRPGDIVRDITFLSYSIGPTRRLSWKELTLTLGLYKDCLLPDYHDCSKCEDYKNCKAYFKDDPKQERCSGWIKDHADEVPDLEEEWKKFIDDLLNNPPKLDLGPFFEKYYKKMLEESGTKEIIKDKSINPLELVTKVYKNTLTYELDSIKVNDDGTTTHLHSDKFLDEHPERKDSPEFTEEEEKEQAEFLSKFTKKTAKEWGSLFKKNFDK